MIFLHYTSINGRSEEIWVVITHGSPFYGGRGICLADSRTNPDNRVAVGSRFNFAADMDAPSNNRRSEHSTNAVPDHILAVWVAHCLEKGIDDGL